MKNYIYNAKTEDECLKKAMSSLNLNKEDIIYKIINQKEGIFNKKCEIEIYKIKDIIEDINEYLEKILKLMEIEATVNIKYNNKILFIDIDSNYNGIIIGKNGETLKSLKNIIINYLKNYTDINIKLDIGSYQKRIDDKLEKSVKKLIDEVEKTGIPYKLDSMNAYQRKIVHELVKQNGNVTSKSYGEEPNRYIEIKRK